MRTNEPDSLSAERSHGFRCKLATCKRQEPHGPQKQHGRRMHVCMDEIEKTESKSWSRAVYRHNNINHHYALWMVNVLVGRCRSGIFWFLRFELRSSWMPRRHAGSSQLCLLALSPSDGARTCFAAYYACAVLAEQRRFPNHGSNISSATNYTLKRTERWEKMPTCPSK